MKLKLKKSVIHELDDKQLSNVSGAGGTQTCSRPCQTTCDSSNCNTTTGHQGGCRPTSRGCECPAPEIVA